MDKAQWPVLKERLSEIFLTKSRDEWCDVMEGTDVCFAPVLTMSEATQHPHNIARGTFVDVAGIVQPGPSPRFSRTEATIQRPPSYAGQHTFEVLDQWLGLTGDAAAELRDEGAVAG
jgi:alpha-methylacyl-CoA racemase